MTPETEKRGEKATVTMAIGRVLKMMHRQHNDGDEAEYFRCRNIIMDYIPTFTDYTPNWAKDRNRGAAGD